MSVPLSSKLQEDARAVLTQLQFELTQFRALTFPGFSSKATRGYTLHTLESCSTYAHPITYSINNALNRQFDNGVHFKPCSTCGSFVRDTVSYFNFVRAMHGIMEAYLFDTFITTTPHAVLREIVSIEEDLYEKRPFYGLPDELIKPSVDLLHSVVEVAVRAVQENVSVHAQSTDGLTHVRGVIHLSAANAFESSAPDNPDAVVLSLMGKMVKLTPYMTRGKLGFWFFDIPLCFMASFTGMPFVHITDNTSPQMLTSAKVFMEDGMTAFEALSCAEALN